MERLAISILLVLLLTLTGCGNAATSEPASDNTPSESVSNSVNETDNTENTETEAPSEPENEEPENEETSKEEEKPVHKHSYTKKVVKATCTAKGYTKYTCECGETYKDNYTAKLEHSYAKKVVKATCEKKGYTKYTCSCGETYKDNYTSKLAHSYGEWEIVKSATTTKTGSKKRVCGKCGNSETETITKRKKAANVDPRVEIGTGRYTGIPQYVLGDCKVIDKRTWGETPTITVYKNFLKEDCMHVTYYNKKNKKIEFDVEPVEDYINSFTIRDDGTFVSMIIGNYT